MTQRNNLTTGVHHASLSKRMLQGAGIALIILIIFLAGAREPDPNWPKFWMLKPLLVVPAAGAIGGAIYYYLDGLRYQGGWKKVLAIVLSLIGYIFVLWIGSVLGFNGTMWN